MESSITNPEKQRVWERYYAGQPERVPVALRTNDRVYMLDGRFNRDGLTYQDVFTDARAMLTAQLNWQYVLYTHFHRYCDQPVGLPERWQVSAFLHNTYEAWALGCPLRLEPGQVPDTVPGYTGDRKWAVFDVDIEHPLQLPSFRRAIELTEQMMELARGMEFHGRPVEVLPYLQTASDGALTVALNVRGGEFLADLVEDPDYADRLLAFITQAAINRVRALLAYWGKELQGELWLADDSIVTISTAMYRERILPHHRHFYEALDPQRKLKCVFHLCGNAARFFPIIVEECGVLSIDTGFPVDLAWLRRAVGPEVEIYGGVEVGLLLKGTPQQVRARTRQVLESGVTAGGRFVLSEANNLPPGVPEENLAAMYQAALEFGQLG